MLFQREDSATNRRAERVAALGLKEARILTARSSEEFGFYRANLESDMHLLGFGWIAGCEYA